MTVPSDTRLTRRTLLALAAPAGLAGLLGGCVSVPSTGSVHPVQPSGSLVQNGGDIEVRPPAADASRRQIVDGFLQSMAEGSSDYAQARQFLTDSAQESWQPDGTVLIYSDSLSTVNETGASIQLRAQFVGQLKNGSYSSNTIQQTIDFGLQKDDQGQWRIATPPDQLLINDQLFEAFYSSYNLYFFNPAFTNLVPDPVFLPYAPESDQLPAALVQSLIAGPRGDLADAVVTAIPPKTTLLTQSVVVTDGIAEVGLSDAVQGLDDSKRSLMVAEISWTLSQVSAVIGVRYNNGSFQVREQIGQGTQGYVPIDASLGYGPVPADSSSTLYGLAGDKIVSVDDGGPGGSPRTEPIPGPLGRGSYELSSIAVAPRVDLLAAVSRDQTTLLTSSLADRQPTAVLQRVTDLIRPDFSRPTGSGEDSRNELWAIGRRDGVQTVWVVRGGKAERVDATALAAGRVTAFRIAPDGSRMAVVQQSSGQSRLGLVTITRNAKGVPSLGSWQPVGLDVGGGSLTLLRDVAWQGPTSLVVLGATAAGATVYAYAASQDGSTVEQIGPSEDWGAKQLTATPSSANGPLSKVIVVGAGNRSWRLESQASWQAYATSLRFACYPG